MRASPRSRAVIAASMARRTSPRVSGPTESRSSHARSMTERSSSFMLVPQNLLEPLADVRDPLIDDAPFIIVVAAFRAVVDPNRRHSERFGGREILDHVVGEQRMRRIDSEALAQQSVAVRIGLGPVAARMDVVQVVEMIADSDPIEHSPRIY